ncbi:hypothetical protein [Amphibacillus indicireducens]|uniref:Uncharacterized protein n=1 Tax=Amphibacillus indicireducens TaxID=1076330 RepID=A0ABP7VQM1_9BACI
MKHPDSAPGILHLLVTLLFLIGLVIFIHKAPRSAKFAQGFKLFLIIGVLAGLIVFGSSMLEGALSNSFIVDVSTAIHYPFYFLFITPLFGLNYLFDLNYEIFSIIMSVVYLILVIFMIKVKKSRRT